MRHAYTTLKREELKTTQVVTEQSEKLSDVLPYEVDTTIFIPVAFVAGLHQFSTLNAAMKHCRNRGIKAGVKITIILEDGTDRDNDYFVPFTTQITVRAETMPINFNQFRDNLTLTPLVANDNTNLANNIADQAANENYCESNMNVVLRYSSGVAIELDGDKIGDIMGIMIVGTSGGTASGLSCGGAGGTTGNGSGLRFIDCVISGFRNGQGINTEYGGAWRSTDEGLIVMYCSVNIQYQYEGNGFSKGVVCIGAVLHNFFYKEKGMGYFSGTTVGAGYRALISHALFSNVAMSYGGNHHSQYTDFGDCGGSCIALTKGGQFMGEDCTFANAGVDTIRNYSGRVTITSSTITNTGTFGIRTGIGSSTYIEDVDLGACGSFAMVIEGGEIDTGNSATGYLTIANDNGGINNKGGVIKGKVDFDHANGSDETNILSFIRHEAGETRLDPTFLVASTTAVRTVYCLRYNSGVLDLRGATVAGVAMTAADVLIRTAANGNSAPVVQSDGVSFYDTGALIAMVG